MIVGQPPDRFAMIIYDVPTASAGRDVLSRAKWAGGARPTSPTRRCQSLPRPSPLLGRRDRNGPGDEPAPQSGARDAADPSGPPRRHAGRAGESAN